MTLLDTYEWRYVGESGSIIPARNSHTLQVIELPTGLKLLALFGGASPDLGPLNDTYFAVLPSDPNSIGIFQYAVHYCRGDATFVSDESFFVKWQPISLAAAPSPREMHAGFVIGSDLYISGGRNEDGILTDTWQLQASTEPLEGGANISDSDNEERTIASVRWVPKPELELPIGLCSQTAAVVTTGSTAVITMFGGLRADGALSSDLYTFDLSATRWNVAEISYQAANSSIAKKQKAASLGARFSCACTTAPRWLLAAGSTACGIAIFGGMTAEEDKNDVWLFAPSTKL
jgi:hypothetical protein